MTPTVSNDSFHNILGSLSIILGQPKIDFKTLGRSQVIYSNFVILFLNDKTNFTKVSSYIIIYF